MKTKIATTLVLASISLNSLAASSCAANCIKGNILDTATPTNYCNIHVNSRSDSILQKYL